MIGQTFILFIVMNLRLIDENIIATTNYISEITAAIKKDNIFGTQFHPEKSHKNGQTIN